MPEKITDDEMTTLSEETARRIEEELHWKPSLVFEEGLSLTVDWYLANQEWMERVTSGAYQSYYDKQYGER